MSNRPYLLDITIKKNISSIEEVICEDCLKETYCWELGLVKFPEYEYLCCSACLRTHYNDGVIVRRVYLPDMTDLEYLTKLESIGFISKCFIKAKNSLILTVSLIIKLIDFIR